MASGFFELEELVLEDGDFFGYVHEFGVAECGMSMFSCRGLEDENTLFEHVALQVNSSIILQPAQGRLERLQLCFCRVREFLLEICRPR